MSGDRGIGEILLVDGDYINKTPSEDSDREGAIYMAAESGRPEMVEVLIISDMAGTSTKRAASSKLPFKLLRIMVV